MPWGLKRLLIFETVQDDKHWRIAGGAAGALALLLAVQAIGDFDRMDKLILAAAYALTCGLILSGSRAGFVTFTISNIAHLPYVSYSTSYASSEIPGMNISFWEFGWNPGLLDMHRTFIEVTIMSKELLIGVNLGGIAILVAWEVLKKKYFGDKELIGED